MKILQIMLEGEEKIHILKRENKSQNQTQDIGMRIIKKFKITMIGMLRAVLGKVCNKKRCII